MLRRCQIWGSPECCSRCRQAPPPRTCWRSPARCCSHSRWRRCSPDCWPPPGPQTQSCLPDSEQWGYWRAWQTWAFCCNIDRRDRRGLLIFEPSRRPYQGQGPRARCRYQSGDFADFGSSNQTETSAHPGKNKAGNGGISEISDSNNFTNLSISGAAVLHYKLLACPQFYLWKGRQHCWSYGFCTCTIRGLLYFG